MLSTSSRQLLTAAAVSLVDSSHSATARSARFPWSIDGRSSVIAGTSLSGAAVRGYAAVAPPPRDPRCATLEESDLEVFRSMLGPNNVLTDASVLQAVNKCAALWCTCSSCRLGPTRRRDKDVAGHSLPVLHAVKLSTGRLAVVVLVSVSCGGLNALLYYPHRYGGC